MKKVWLSLSLVAAAVVVALVFSGVLPPADDAAACNPKIERC